MTVGDALALAGGPTSDGKDEVKLLRAGNELRDDVTRTDLVMDAFRSGDELLVPRRAWISRNSTVVFGAFASALGVTLASLVR
ncbi:MAG: hypothetical protein GWN53_02905, partial [Gammaproteobacteria bacterium]|nr:hypothetical protein [Gemmatimonadota bacterium]NIT65070.1 hypothetical protein [Gemmatimonadota bacterium]NIV50826.1 hypothetical protein [Gammaproteobacteria bacterium]NIY33649.1 hypothetical protein [Gemmatimonadota bacterium]